MTQNVLPADGFSDATGLLNINFPLTNVNTTYTGTVSIPSAPDTALILIQFNNQTVAKIAGWSQFGPFQLGPSDKLTLVGIGMEPSTQYQGVMIGGLVYGQSPPGVIPIPTAGVPTVQGGQGFPAPTLIQSGNLTEGTPSAPITAPPLTRVLIIELDGAGSNVVTVTGTSTGVRYANRAVVIMGTGGVGVLYVPYDPTIDPQFTLEVA